MTKEDYEDITEALLRVICKADEEFQEQLATGIGIGLDTFQEYLETVDISGATIRKSKS
jgi:hypothetical protein